MPEIRMVNIQHNTTLVQKVALEERARMMQSSSITQYFDELYDEIAAEVEEVYDEGDGDIDETNRLSNYMGDVLARQQLLGANFQASFNAYRLRNPVNAWGERLAVREVLGADPGQKLQVGVVDEDMGLFAEIHHEALIAEDAQYQGVPQLNNLGVDVQRELFLAPVRQQVKVETRSHFRTISGKEYRYNKKYIYLSIDTYLQLGVYLQTPARLNVPTAVKRGRKEEVSFGE